MRNKQQNLPMQEVEINNRAVCLSKQIQKKSKGFGRFKVMNSPIYSIQSEVIKEFEYLKLKSSFYIAFS